MTNRFQKIFSTAEVAPDDATDYVAVLDATTGLMWSRDSLPGGEVNQASAEKAASECDLLCKNDWRLPTRAELLTLVDDTRDSPAIDPIFNCESDWYWTSTPAACSPAVYAWYVFFSFGGCNWGDRDGSGFVRAVRVSQ